MVSVRTVALLVASACLICGQENSPLAKHAFDASEVSKVSNAPPRAEPPAPGKLSSEQQGDLYMARKMFRDAIDAYREGPQNSPVTWNKIGIAYHQLGDLGAAKRNYEKAMRVDKKYAEAVNNDGTVYYAQKKYRTAISRYKKAIELNGGAASFWSNLGTAYYSRGRFNEMAIAYRKALELDPEVFEHHGLVGTELQDRTVADRARYHYEMALIYAKSGRDELALRYLRRSLEEGFKDKTKMIQAPEFAKLRDTDAFKELLALEPRVL
jgi:tetratricopeptide (TPR) repeat protein